MNKKQVFKELKMKRWASLIRKYEEILVGQDFSPGTIDGRISELDKFGLWLKKRKPLSALEPVAFLFRFLCCKYRNSSIY